MATRGHGSQRGLGQVCLGATDLGHGLGGLQTLTTNNNLGHPQLPHAINLLAFVSVAAIGSGSATDCASTLIRAEHPRYRPRLPLRRIRACNRTAGCWWTQLLSTNDHCWSPA